MCVGGLSITIFTTCPLTADTFQNLDSLSLLRQPCLPHHHYQRSTSYGKKKRKQSCQRGKRGGKRINVKPVKNFVSPSVINHLNQNETHQSSISNFLNIRLWNARSIWHKTTTVSDCIISDNVDIMFLTEILAERERLCSDRRMYPSNSYVCQYP